eukprot:jgi/Chrzof1/3592/Cz13g01180.t1
MARTKSPRKGVSDAGKGKQAACSWSKEAQQLLDFLEQYGTSKLGHKPSTGTLDELVTALEESGVGSMSDLQVYLVTVLGVAIQELPTSSDELLDEVVAVLNPEELAPDVSCAFMISRRNG